MKSRALVLGTGGFGTALAIVLDQSGHDVRVWGNDGDYARHIETERDNSKFLPGIEIPQDIRFSGEIAELASGAELVVSAVPTQFLRSALERLRPDLPETALWVSCSKGFERGTLARPSTLIEEVLPRASVAILSGPSHAEEVSRLLPTTVVVASERIEIAQRVQQEFSATPFRVYASDDPLGVEIAGATKNVIALAAGISDGLGFGDNARAALVCRGAREITRFGMAQGARRETFAGLSGIGDLVATCTSVHSRNHAVGERIGRGETLAEILASSEKVAEGVETTRSLHQIAEEIRVELPITSEVYAVLFEDKSPRQAVEDLLERELKNED